MFPNKSDLDKFIDSNSTPNNEELSSFFSLAQSEVTANIESAFSTGSDELNGKTDIEFVSPGNNHLLIIIILLNLFAIVIVCCILGICVYCKRKLIFHKLFEVNKDGNVYDRNRLHENRFFFREILHKSEDFDLEITNMDGNSLQRFTSTTILALWNKEDIWNVIYTKVNQIHILFQKPMLQNQNFTRILLLFNSFPL